MYLRVYHKKFQKNLDTEQMLREAETGIERLNQINANSRNTLHQRMAQAVSSQTITSPLSELHQASSPTAETAVASAPFAFGVRRPRPVGPSPARSRAGITTVGGQCIYGPEEDPSTADSPPVRKKKRARRHCKVCVCSGETRSVALGCPGRTNRKLCPLFPAR